jgi:hypothetical protein
VTGFSCECVIFCGLNSRSEWTSFLITINTRRLFGCDATKGERVQRGESPKGRGSDVCWLPSDSILLAVLLQPSDFVELVHKFFGEAPKHRYECVIGRDSAQLGVDIDWTKRMK